MMVRPVGIEHSLDVTIQRLHDAMGAHIVSPLVSPVSLGCRVPVDRRQRTACPPRPRAAGVIMGTRSGDLDPGVLIYLMREKQFDAAMLEDLVDHRSGLVGISAISSDMRRLHDAASRDPGVRLAIKMFCYSVRKQIAAMIAVLDGIDMIVFTGGIGENDGEARASICAGLSWVGINLDPAQDLAGCSINDSASHVRVRVFASQENKQIARHAWALSRPGLSQ